MTSFENLQLRVQSSGGSIAEERRQNAKRRIEDSFERDPSYIKNGVTIWGGTRKIYPQIIEHKSKQSSAPQRKILSKPSDTFNVGDIMILPDGSKWLCIEMFDGHGINNIGLLQYCQYELSVLKADGSVFKIPVSSSNSTQNGSGDNQSDTITVGASRHKLYVPYTTDTIKFDNDHRILIDRNLLKPTAFQITQVDPITFSYGGNGYIQWTLTETQRNDKTDNYNLMIANYYSQSDTYIVFISNATSPISLQSGADYQLAATVTKNGSSDQTPIWFYSSDTSIATVSSTGKIHAVKNGTCTITAKVADSEQVVTVNVKAAVSGAEIRVNVPSGESEVPYDSTLRVEFNAYVNGVLASTTFVCSISGNVLPVATVVETGSDYAVIKAANNEAYIGETFVFTVTSSALSATASVQLKVGGWF